MKRLFLLMLTCLLLTACSKAPDELDNFAMDWVASGRTTADMQSEKEAGEQEECSQWTEGFADVEYTAGNEKSYGTEANLVSISISIEQTEVVAEDKTVLFSQQMQVPTVSTSLSSDAACNINTQVNTFLHRKDSEVEEWEQWASEHYRLVTSEDSKDDYGFYGYSRNLSVTPQRLDESYISLLFSDSTYLGGAHPNNDQSALNFDAASGGVLSLANVFKPQAKDMVLNLILNKLKEVETTFGLFDGYQETVREKFENMTADFAQNWYLTDSSVVFFFNPYEISPYASGTVVVDLSYETLSVALKDNFVLPQERVLDAGTVNLVEGASLENYANIIDVGPAEEGQPVYLASDSIVYDLRLYQMYWVDGQYNYQRLVYAANRFDSEDVLSLELPEEDLEQPEISVSYTDEHKNSVEYYVSAQAGTQALIIAGNENTVG